MTDPNLNQEVIDDEIDAKAIEEGQTDPISEPTTATQTGR